MAYSEQTVFNEEFWSINMQVVFQRESIAKVLANTEQRELLSKGDTLNKPYRSHLQIKDYTPGTDVTVQDVSGTNEQLTVTNFKIVPFYVDDLDQLRNKWDVAAKWAEDAGRQLNSHLAQQVAKEASNATSTVDDGDVGGSAGTNITIGPTVIDKIFSAAHRKLDRLDINQAGRFALIGPRFLAEIRNYLGGKESALGDIVGQNGKVMNRFGFEIFYSNNIYYTATLGMATQVTESDTVSIEGVAFTFNATPSGAGSVDIGATTAVSVDNLVAAINDSGTAGTTYIQLSDANRWKLVRAGIVATDGTTEMTLVGYGDIIVAETLSAAADVWSVQIQHNLFGLRGATDLVVQKEPSIAFKDDPDRLGKNIFSWMLYGIKTFADMKDALVDVKLNASSWT